MYILVIIIIIIIIINEKRLAVDSDNRKWCMKWWFSNGYKMHTSK